MGTKKIGVKGVESQLWCPAHVQRVWFSAHQTAWDLGLGGLESMTALKLANFVHIYISMYVNTVHLAMKSLGVCTV